jgi:hypothetical protein
MLRPLIVLILLLSGVGTIPLLIYVIISGLEQQNQELKAKTDKNVTKSSV